jgi:hypothetical protein
MTSRGGGAARTPHLSGGTREYTPRTATFPDIETSYGM